jgi:hypothetical protein
MEVDEAEYSKKENGRGKEQILVRGLHTEVGTSALN